MSPIDGSAIIWMLLSLAGGLIVFIYIDDRRRFKQDLENHDTRIVTLEKLDTHYQLLCKEMEHIRGDIREIKEAVKSGDH